jgi:ELWxxDGT repeat protein
MKSTFVVFLACLCTTLASAQDQLTSLTATNQTNVGSTPSDFVPFKDDVIFKATTRDGAEFWKSDGTAAGTTMLKDISLLTFDVSSNVVVLKDKAYFVAYDEANSYQLWESDGTEQGTKRITTNISRPVRNLVSDGNQLYFIVERIDQPIALDVWKSDGTAAGTKVIKGDLSMGNAYSNLITAGGKAYFSARPLSGQKDRIWCSDGTANGTLIVSEEVDGIGINGTTQTPNQFVDYKGNLYFVGSNSQFGSPMTGILKSDGTVAGTGPVKGLQSNTRYVDFGGAIVHNDKLYFSFFELDYNRFFIWESDGTSAGTKLILDQTYPDFFVASNLLGQGNYLYFTLGNAGKGTSLVKFDLTSQTFEEIKEISPVWNAAPSIFNERSANTILQTDNGTLYVKSIVNSNNKARLWTSNGTAAGTLPLDATDDLGDVVVTSDRLFFAGIVNGESELWSSGGALSTTDQVKDIQPGIRTLLSTSVRLLSTGMQAMFHAYQPGVTDGTAAGTSLLSNTWPAGGGSAVQAVKIKNQYCILTSPGSDGKADLYKSNGTTAGTELLKTFGAYEYPDVMIADGTGESAYILVMNADYSWSLYKTDLTAAGTVEVKRIGSENFYLYSYYMVAGSSSIYFVLSGAYDDVWKSDGTAAGTIKVGSYKDASGLVVVQNTAYFSASPKPSWPDIYDNRKELYKSDGTVASTGRVKDLNGEKSPEATMLNGLGNKLFFMANAEDSGRELWVTDGTDAGTKMMKDINPGTNSGIQLSSSVVKDEVIYFAANDGEHGAELWKTNGTPETTSMVKDLFPGAESSKPTGFTLVDGVIYFRAYDPAHGMELWTTDGTAAGTRMVADVIKGPESAYPFSFCKVNDKLVFYAWTELEGIQLWSVDPSTITAIDEELAAFAIYPNPSTGIFKMNINDSVLQNAAIEVFAVDGSPIQNATNMEDKRVVNLSHAPSGIYLIKLSSGANQMIKKVVKI